MYSNVKHAPSVYEYEGHNYSSVPGRIYHVIEYVDGDEMGFGNYEHPEEEELRVHGDAYIAESLYVGANITVSIWNETCCARLYNGSGDAWVNTSTGVQYTEETCPSCVTATCNGCRVEILLADYIEDTVRQMDLLYQVLFSASYDVVAASDSAAVDAAEDGEVIYLPLKITRNALFTGTVDIEEEET